jgi:hypothetical protein
VNFFGLLGFISSFLDSKLLTITAIVFSIAVVLVLVLSPIEERQFEKSNNTIIVGAFSVCVREPYGFEDCIPFNSPVTARIYIEELIFQNGNKSIIIEKKNE